MALDVNTLESNLKSTFSKMKKSGKDAKDTDFSDGISNACKTFAEGGTITTTDGGTVSSGVFAGGGSGSISVTASSMSTPIVTAMNTMKTMTSGGDSVLATAIFNGLKAMISGGTVETNVIGATTSPTGSAVPPTSGTAKGTMSCSYENFVKELKQIFQDMIDRAGNNFNGDDYLAENLASLINKYVKTGVVSTSGQGEISGVSGAGGIA